MSNENDPSFEIEKEYQREIAELKSELDKTTFCLEQEQKMREEECEKNAQLIVALEVIAYCTNFNVEGLKNVAKKTLEFYKETKNE